MGDIRPYLDSLAALAHADGGWGYAPGQPSHLEPTCLALLALSLDAETFAEPIAAGQRFLDRCAGEDGSVRLDRGRPEAVWTTALALFVRAALGAPPTDLQKPASFLLSLKGRTPDEPGSAELHDIDHRLVGWPWAENNFSWAEPTAWACLALRRAGLGDHPRVDEGLRLLLDRAADDGGINYGNRHVFGRRTEPLPEPTALMLLAFQGKDDHPRVGAAIAYLICQAQGGGDLAQLAWAKLALEPYRHRPEERSERMGTGPLTQGSRPHSFRTLEVAEFLPTLDEHIRRAYEDRRAIHWLSPAPLREALTALALAADRHNYFRVPDGLPRPAVEPSLPARKRPPVGDRLRSAFRGFLLEGAGRLKPLAPQTSVHIAPAANYQTNLAGLVQEQYQSFRDKVPLKGKRVVLKPNLVEYHRDKVINTHPNVVAAVIELCQREGAAEVIVAEGPGHCRNVEHLVRASGLGDVLRHYRVSFVDLNHDDPVKTLNLGRLTKLDHLYLARTVVQADVLISLPKLKTHHWAGATLSLKNLFGTLPGICYGWPKNELHWRGIDNSIIDIALTRTPDLAIVDAVIGMEGDGPLIGTPKPLGALVMGTDLMAVDATCCRLMQLDPERVGYLQLGRQKRLGLLDAAMIRQLGEPVDRLAQPFETLPHLRSLQLRRSGRAESEERRAKSQRSEVLSSGS